MQRRGLMIGIGAFLVVVSLAAVVSSMSHVWVQSAAVERYNEEPDTSRAPSLLAVIGGLGLAGGFTLIGIGMGRWGRPRRPLNEADYTGPGTSNDSHGTPPRVV